MRVSLNFLSLLALGLLISGALALALNGLGLWVDPTEGGALPLDYASLVLGLVLGLSLSSLADIDWLEMPRRFVTWLWQNERNFYRFGMACCLLGVLLFY